VFVEISDVKILIVTKDKIVFKKLLILKTKPTLKTSFKDGKKLL